MDKSELATYAIKNMNKHRRDVFKAYKNFGDQIKKDSSLDPKVQSLIKVGMSVLLQCETCISLNVQEAAVNGATKEEIIDAGLLAISMGGSPKMMYLGYLFEEIENIF